MRLHNIANEELLITDEQKLVAIEFYGNYPLQIRSVLGKPTLWYKTSYGEWEEFPQSSMNGWLKMAADHGTTIKSFDPKVHIPGGFK